MVLGSFAAVGLALALAFGWHQFFNERARRAQMAQLAAAATQRASLMAAQRASDSEPGGAAIRAAVTETTPKASPAPAMTLRDQAADDVSADLSPMVRLAEPATPDRLAAASAVLQRFWHATAWADKLACVHDPVRVKPLLQTYYETQRNKDPMSGALAGAGRFRVNGRELLVLSYASSLPGNELSAIMVCGADGSYLLDWESYVGWGDMSVQEFKKQRPSKPQLMRVYARNDVGYQGGFSDPSLYLGLELLSPDGLYYLHGYCEKNSTVGQAVASAVAGGSQAKLTLRLAYPAEGKAGEAVLITGLAADRWLMLK